MDVNDMAAALFAQVREYVAKAVGPLADRIKAMEERPPPDPGKDADPAWVDEAVDKRLPAMIETMRAGLFGHLDARLDEAVKALPIPKDGEPGKNGTSVTVEDLHPILMSEFANLALSFERRAQDALLKAVSNIPRPKDGRDALDLEDFDFQVDGRSLTISLRRGEVEVSKTARLRGLVLDAGFYQPGKAYEQGDGTTFGGSYWIAQKDTDTKPEVGNDDWRLAVKKGRDLRDVSPREIPRKTVQVGYPPGAS